MAHSQVVPECPKEQRAVLGNEGETTPEDVEPDIFDIAAVDRDASVFEVDDPE